MCLRSAYTYIYIYTHTHIYIKVPEVLVPQNNKFRQSKELEGDMAIKFINHIMIVLF